jgi:hypothetical protein
VFASAIALNQVHLDQPNAKLYAEALIALARHLTVSLTPSPSRGAKDQRTTNMINIAARMLITARGIPYRPETQVCHLPSPP